LLEGIITEGSTASRHHCLKAALLKASLLEGTNAEGITA